MVMGISPWCSSRGTLSTDGLDIRPGEREREGGEREYERGRGREGVREKETGGWVEGRIDGEVERWKDRGTEG